MNPLLLTDGYKTSHRQQYPQGTTLVYSGFTPRSSKHSPTGKNYVVNFGQQMTMIEIHNSFQEHFFDKPKELVCGEIKSILSSYLGSEYDVTHFEKLHDLGYLPIKVKSLPEGSISNVKIPVLTIQNTHPEFFWITNYLETIISNLLWKPMTSASIAYEYKKILLGYALQTDKDNVAFVDFQGHDFSMRGMDSVYAVMSSGLGHLTSFLGSDSLPVIHAANKYYNSKDVCFSVPATEHSVMCSGTKDDEIGTFRYLMQQFPTGILSIVSDTWDLWKVCTEYLPILKEEILSRDGKIVIRPDSGDPVDILCGYTDFRHFDDYLLNNERITQDERDEIQNTYNNHPEYKGVIELLWDVFGGTINEQGYKVLDPRIGAIYGDSITLDRAKNICERLKDKGFASTNVVLGIGSFTYQYNTRDTFGFAMKATYVEVNGEGREIFKDPITDDGTKKSATGLMAVYQNEYDGSYELIDKASKEQESDGCLSVIYKDGEFYNLVSLSDIRSRISK